MIWFALIAAIVVFLVYFLFTRSLKKALRAGLLTLIIGVSLSLILILSGLMGG